MDPRQPGYNMPTMGGPVEATVHVPAELLDRMGRLLDSQEALMERLAAREARPTRPRFFVSEEDDLVDVTEGLEDFGDRLDAIEARIEDVLSAVQALSDEVSDLQRAVEPIENSIESLDSTLGDVQATVDRIESTVDAP